MTLLLKVQKKLRTDEYTKEFYENRIISLGVDIIDFVRLNTNDEIITNIFYKKVLVTMIQICNKELTNINHNAKLNIENYIYEKESEVLLEPRFIFYNFLGAVISCHVSKYDVITWIKIGEKLKIDIKEILLSILKEE